MRIFGLVLVLVFICSSWVLAEEELEGFVVTPQSAEFALYDYYLSPSSVEVTLACVGKRVVFEETIGDQTFTYTCDFDCDTTDFEWQVISERPWVHFEPARGTGETLSRIRVTVDEDYLKNISPEMCDGDVPCFTSDVTIRITYHLHDCAKYSDNSTTPVSVTYYSEKTFPNFIRVYYSVAGLSPRISPAEVSFRGEVVNGTVEFEPVVVQVLAGHQGWDYTSAAPWLSLTKEPGGPTEGYLDVQPVNLKEPGHYRGYVRIRDRATGRISSLLTTVEVLGAKAGEAKLFYALFPDGVYTDRVELAAAQWFDAKIYLGPNVGPLPLYVAVTHSAFPGYEFAYRWQAGAPTFTVASYQGVPVPEADDLYYAANGAEEVHIGGFRLAYLPGTAHIRLRQGASWTSGSTILDLELVIHGLTGSWKVVDTYNGVEYEHPFPLITSEGLTGLSASWGDYQPEIRYSADPTVLYEILFSARDYLFRYQINHLEPGYISGLWSYSPDGVLFSDPQPFYGIKLNP